MNKKNKSTKNKKDQAEGMNFTDEEIQEMKKQAEDLLEYFVDALDLEVETTCEKKSYKDEDNIIKHFIKIDIDGEDLGVLIGYRGRNLRAVQKIFTMIVNRRLDDTLGEDRFIRVVIDVSGYRDNRKQSLQDMAERIRREVVETGEPVDMPSMTSYERRVIHVHLDHFSDVTTESFGKTPNRYVTVLPVADEAADSSDSDEDSEAEDLIGDDFISEDLDI
jgi:spoIIIJ-associated protein